MNFFFGSGKINKIDKENLSLSFRALVKIPETQLKLIRDFKNQSLPKKEGGVKTFNMEHQRSDGSEISGVWALKQAPMNSWRFNYSFEGVPQKVKKFSRRADFAEAIKKAAETLAEEVTLVKDRFERVTKFNLTRANILDYEYRKHEDAKLHDGVVKNEPEEMSGDAMIVTARIPMPKTFYDFFDKVCESVAFESGKKSGSHFKIGVNKKEDSHSPGIVTVTKLGTSEWQASGAGKHDYSQKFEKMSQKDVIRQIAYDLAAEHLQKSDIVPHICGHALQIDEVEGIGTDMYYYDQENLHAEAEVLEQG